MINARTIMCGWAICAAFLYAAPAVAAPQTPAHGSDSTPPTAGAAHGDAGHEGSGEGDGDAHAGETPSILSGDLGNVVWTLAIFFVLLFTLRMTAWKPILGALQQREKFIHDSLSDARREREESERLLKQYRQQLDKSRVEASAIVDEGKRDAEVVRRRIEGEARKEAEALLDRARREIEVARDSAIKELYERTITLSIDVAGKIVGRQLTADDHRALLDESIGEMAKAETK